MSDNHLYTPEDIEQIRAEARRDEVVASLCASHTKLQEVVANIPRQIETAMTGVAESVRSEFKPVREALLGNGDPTKSISAAVIRNTEALESLAEAEVIRSTERNTTNIKILLVVFSLLVSGAFGVAFFA